MQTTNDPLNVQVGGNHYKKFKIQPIEFTVANNLGFLEGNVVKYVSRHGDKKGAEDIEKVKHYADFILKFHYGDQPRPVVTDLDLLKDVLLQCLDAHGGEAVEAFLVPIYDQWVLDRAVPTEKPTDAPLVQAEVSHNFID